MGKKENNIEHDCRLLARVMGWEDYKGSGHNGAADAIFLKGGRGFTVEFKTDKGALEKSQVIESKRMLSKGIPYYVCRTLDIFKDILIEEEEKFKKL